MIHAMKQRSNDVPHKSALLVPPGLLLSLWSCELLALILGDLPREKLKLCVHLIPTQQLLASLLCQATVSELIAELLES
tara:strand:+ start:335 stop:571 length:237 start_codon:yes stop_codon:yes gene_type:complete